MQTYGRWTLVSLFLLAASLSFAQDKAPSAPGKQGAAAAEFARLLAQLKKIDGDLKTLQAQYPSADAAQRTAIKKEAAVLLDKGNALQDPLIAAAKKAYLEAPNADNEVTEFLVMVLQVWTQHDDFEAAYALGKLLLEHQCPIRVSQVAALTGMSAFAIGELDAAEKYLRMAAKAGVLTKDGQAILQNMPASKKAWEKEKTIRLAEAKANDLPRVLLKTSQGDIEIELFENEAPNTVANFLTLVEKGFYNGLTFHRVLPGFMAQGGDPKGDGGGGPGYCIPEEYTRPNHRLHFRGSLAMARSDAPDSAGSQFFLMFMPNNQLDGKYTVFGRMTKGFEVLAKIRRRNPAEPDPPAPDKIIKAEVLRKRPHKYEVKKVAE
jgi:cyclophilin family peptidyl-prolyl cis-trans isomerase